MTRRAAAGDGGSAAAPVELGLGSHGTVVSFGE